ncbi:MULTISPECIES: hypothetical protein, partial [unclassified Undibacterium]|uniref:hypothetical protein n=1 Tax=unclassified Undibacterium TaxID=2630295 RepID=UPI002B237E6C
TLGMNGAGQHVSAGDQHISAKTLDLSGSRNSGKNLSYTASQGDLNLAHATVNASSSLSAQSTQVLNFDAAQITAGQLALAAHDLSNVAGSLMQTGSGDTRIDLAGSLNNTQGTIAVNSNNFSVTAATLINTAANGQQGKIQHTGTGTLALHANQVLGSGGLIQTNNVLDMQADSATLDG